MVRVFVGYHLRWFGLLLYLCIAACNQSADVGTRSSTTDVPALEQDLDGNDFEQPAGASGPSDSQGKATTKVFEKDPDLASKQTREQDWEERRANYETSRVEKVCATLYAYDPSDTAVNLRARPAGNVVAQLPNLSEVYRSDDPYASIDPGTWNAVILKDGTQGYIWGDLLRRTVYRTYDAGDTSVNFRRSPGGEVTIKLTNDTEVDFLGETGAWTHVRLGRGSEGYVATSLLANPNCF